MPSTLQQARASIAFNANKFRPDFFEWIADNFILYEYFEAEAMKFVKVGCNRIGARMIVENMRYKTKLREIGDGAYKINNNYTPCMAHLFSMLNPKCAGLFLLKGK